MTQQVRLLPSSELFEPLVSSGASTRRLAADVVSLLCLRNAKEGGLSSWSSSISVYNEILRRRPDLAHLLAGPWFFDRKGEVPPGKKAFFEIPVFNFHKASRRLHDCRVTTGGVSTPAL